MTTTRVYRGFRRESAGWIFGLSGLRAIAVAALAVPVVWAISAGRWWTALILALVCGAVAALMIVPVRGRPAARWLVDWVLHQVGVVFGWSRWQSRAAAGLPVAPDEPDLPGVLSRFTMPDGPPYRGRRVCLLHDTADGRWGATARLVHTGVGLTSAEVREMLASRLGTMLRSLGQRGVIDRVSVVVRSVPDDGVEDAIYRARHQAPDAPELAIEAADELSRIIGKASVRHEVFVTVSATEDALRRPARAAGGGVDGRAAVLYRALDGVEDPLRSLGASSVQWLDGAQMAEAIRTAFNPQAAAVLTSARLTGDAGDDRGLPLAAAGATRAPSPDRRAYHHDGSTSVSYSVLMPPTGTTFGSLGPLLAIRSPGERRTLAIHYEILPQTAASRDVRRQRFAAGLAHELKARRGFARTATDSRLARTAGAQEQAVDAGHALVRYAVSASITVPSDESIEDHAARMESDIAGRFRLLRLELAQDSGFVAACVPVGVGLPRVREGLL
ncbi:SCO6880 family protein [Saccharopolyspora elongata]|uniref:PrgI family protein n=1 Tax=Saccharopolyspora elongata TaxID=2530387 RepID=A0A4R4Y0N2_9PSEU|nr:SCO6880 family protein [Saccharopolyspora elongata]TDD37781.1 hypothetical protein E1288_39950 [Saccharopolyspora elongata]